MILKNYRYFSTKPWKGMAHVLRPQFFCREKQLLSWNRKCEKKVNYHVYIFFPHVKLVKKKDIHIHNEKVFQVHVFNYPGR